MKSGSVPVLMYHRILPNNNDEWSLPSLNLKIFEKQLSYLKKNYNIISLNRLANFISAGKIDDKKSKKPIVITFDDGYKDNYTYVYPILKKYDINATFFLVTHSISNRDLFWWDKLGYVIYKTQEKQLIVPGLKTFFLNSNQARYRAKIEIINTLKQVAENIKNDYLKIICERCRVSIPPNIAEKIMLSWAEIKEMSESGMDFGAHTMNHTILSRISDNQTINEISNSKQIIEENIQKPVVLFSYPNGGVDDFSANHIEILKKLYFTAAVTTISGSNTVKTNPFKLKRINAECRLIKLVIKLNVLN